MTHQIGAVISRAAVVAQNFGAGAEYSIEINAAGEYQLRQLASGNDQVQARANHFEETLEQIELIVSDPATANVKFRRKN